MTRQTGRCARPACRRPVSGLWEYCSNVCETAGSGLRSGSQGQTGKPVYAGSGDLSVLAGVTGAGLTPGTAGDVRVSQGEPKPASPRQPVIRLAAPPGDEQLAADQCRECGCTVSPERVRLLAARHAPLSCTPLCAAKMWRRVGRRKAAANASGPDPL